MCPTVRSPSTRVRMSSMALRSRLGSASEAGSSRRSAMGRTAELVELVAGDLPGADQDLAQRIRAPRAADEADALVQEVDDFFLRFLVDREESVAAVEREHLKDVGDAQDLHVAADFAHLSSHPLLLGPDGEDHLPLAVVRLDVAEREETVDGAHGDEPGIDRRVDD